LNKLDYIKPNRFLQDSVTAQNWVEFGEGRCVFYVIRTLTNTRKAAVITK